MVWVAAVGVGLLLLFMFPKQMGIVAGVAALAAAAIVTLMYLEHQRGLEEQRRREEGIELSAFYDTILCPPEHPIVITIRNNYTETLQALTFKLGGYRPDYSSPVYFDQSYSSDRILAPGESHSWCWAVPTLQYGAQEAPPADLQWRATYSYATFGAPP